MANHPPNGRRSGAVSDETEASWRPQDQAFDQAFRGRGRDRDADDDRDYRSWRDTSHGDRDAYRDDHDRDRGRSTEPYGQGQSGYSAGRHGGDRAQQLQGRNDMMPSPGSFEDRHRDLGTDDRFTGRGRAGYWQDRTGYDAADRYGGYRGRDFDAERRSLEPGRRSHDERLGYPAGSYSHQAEPPRRAGIEPHVHRGNGPHRGKGPASYQRSDERIRELVCESLTEDDQLDATHIEVTVKGGEVTLSGTVEDRRAKREAEDCACSVPGVRDVQNQLRVGDDRARSNPSSAASVVRSETEPSAQDKKHRA